MMEGKLVRIIEPPLICMLQWRDKRIQYDVRIVAHIVLTNKRVHSTVRDLRY